MFHTGLLLVAALTLLAAQPASPADLILIDANIHTQDPFAPHAEAVALRAGRIVLVGSTAQARALAGAATRVIDLKGATVVPGLIDAHGHVLSLGLALDRLDLVGTGSPEQIVDLVRAKAREAGPGAWIQGRGWDQNDWPVQSFPTRDMLDPASEGNPVALTRIDGHALWANSEAIRRAGVTAATPDPPGGQIIRARDGSPSGIFIDNATYLISRSIPPPSTDQIRAGLERGMRRCLQVGLTGAHDAGVSAQGIEAYRELLDEEDLPFRVYAMLNDDPDLLESWFARGPGTVGRTGRLTVRAVKLYIDGALGSRGAALLEPYSDDPGNRGLLVSEPAHIRQRIRQAARAGFQPCVHAIGDRGNRLTLDAYQEALDAGVRDLRPRIEHAQILSLQDIPRFARLGVIASMQPTHATSDLPWAPSRLGPERLQGGYAWQRLLASGARLACGSDFPVESPDPLLGFYAAITRQDTEGHPEGGWSPDQRLTREQALRCFTRDAAYAAFEEDSLGSISVGKRADLTVLSRDIMEIPAREILRTEVVLTIVDGRVAYERP